jgi:sulfur-oxidizing protein SoxY
MTEMKRRIFLKGSLAAGAVGFAVGAGLVAPRTVLAEWSADAFAAKEIPGALKGMYGMDTAEASDAIKIKAPDIAENGAVVPITIQTDMEGVTNIALLAAANAAPLVADFQLSEDSVPFVSTRIKMGKTGDVIAVVKTGDKLYEARKSVKVTIGGCGG